MAKNGLYEEVTIAGFGGQGIILVGKLLAQAAMKAGKEVTFMPSYGAEVRAGHPIAWSSFPTSRFLRR